MKKRLTISLMTGALLGIICIIVYLFRTMWTTLLPELRDGLVLDMGT